MPRGIHVRPYSLRMTGCSFSLGVCPRREWSFSAMACKVEEVQRVFNIPMQIQNGAEVIEVTCGHCTGRLHMRLFTCPGLHSRCIEFMGVYITPKEFTKMAGKDKQKDWKGSIRINNVLLRVLMANKAMDFYNHDRDCSKRCVSRNHLNQNHDGSARRGRRSRESTEFYHQGPNGTILIQNGLQHHAIADPYSLHLAQMQQLHPGMDYTGMHLNVDGIGNIGMDISHMQNASELNPSAQNHINLNSAAMFHAIDGRTYRENVAKGVDYAERFVLFMKESFRIQMNELVEDITYNEETTSKVVSFLSALPASVLAARIFEGLVLEDDSENFEYEVDASCDWNCPCHIGVYGSSVKDDLGESKENKPVFPTRREVQGKWSSLT